MKSNNGTWLHRRYRTNSLCLVALLADGRFD